MMRWLAVAFLLIAPSAFALSVTQANIRTHSGNIPLTLEVAANPEARATGLMKRKTLAPFDGMLFVWPKPQEASFWMKDTMIPLDILFIDSEGVIRHIASNATPYSLEPISSGGVFLTAIEIAGGRAKKENITVGSRVQLTIPKELRIE